MSRRGANAGEMVSPAMFDQITVFRFWCKVRIAADGCWTWTGTTNTQGYGQIRVGRARVFAHRMAVALDGRVIPKGMVVDHLCRNHGCVNPNHLQVVTQQTNILRGESPTARVAVTGKCIRGHDMDGRRRCRVCNNARARKHRSLHADTYRQRGKDRYRRLGRERYRGGDP